MTPEPRNLGESMLARMDQWSRRSHWLPRQDEWFPWRVFWGIFVWNLPVLLLAVFVIGFALYRADADPSNIGFFTPLNWLIELCLVTLTLATAVDFIGCLYLRRMWNRRVRRNLKKLEAKA